MGMSTYRFKLDRLVVKVNTRPIGFLLEFIPHCEAGQE